ncbi:mirror-image polydactyly gene 1 protein isoform X2 [Scleropages formosus]|uniref:mirror-image polydactyly gene 1 protein isoform X2 n=1 Tax=Scleropages formosus TaxID=113540 RepID=UPI0008782110|nr:mirror-image polydactyly gene 1 protein isoform X2 [Scleropages formosus]
MSAVARSDGVCPSSVRAPNSARHGGAPTMDAGSKVCDIHDALRRAKWKMSSLQQELWQKENCFKGEEELWIRAERHRTEPNESLVDMYKANPKVNDEVRERLCFAVQRRSSDSAATLRLPTLNDSCNIQIISATALEDLPKESRVCQSPGTKKEQAGEALPEPGCGAGDLGGMGDEEVCRGPGFLKPGGLMLKRRGEEAVTGHLLALEDSGNTSAASVQEDHSKTKASSDFNSAKPLPVLDKERNIAFLLKELDSLRDLNKKLQDQLAAKERELENRLVDAELKETALEAKACEKAGALVEEIYAAQRDRDRALMARLRLANEERDEALLRARRLQQAATELENISPEEYDADLEDLLNRVNSADSAQDIERSGAVIIDRLQKAQERRRKITAEEMNAVIEERDAVLTRCKRLEQDLHQVREQSRPWANNSRHLTGENNEERARKEELDAVRKERDWAFDQNRKLEKEIHALRVYISQHQSLSQEAAVIEQFKGTSSSIPEAQHSETQASQAHLQNQQLLGQLQLLSSEYQSIQSQLQQSQDAEREAKDKVQKLERLVEVLRKKVGTGSVRTVI